MIWAVPKKARKNCTTGRRPYIARKLKNLKSSQLPSSCTNSFSFVRKFVNLLWPNRFSYESEIFREAFWLSKIARKMIRSNLSARIWKLWWFQILQLTHYVQPPSCGVTCTAFFGDIPHHMNINKYHQKFGNHSHL